MPYYWVMVCEVSTQCKGNIHPRTGHKGNIHPRTGHKGNICPRTGHKGPEEKSKYNTTLSLTSALDQGGWVMSRPGRVAPRNDPLYRRLGGFQCRSRTPTGIRSLDQPACSKLLHQLHHPSPCSTMQHNVLISNCCNAQEKIFIKS